MAKNQKRTFTLDLDTSGIISNYRRLIGELEKGGTSANTIRGLNDTINSLERQFKDLKKAGKDGFINEREVRNFGSNVDRVYQQLEKLGAKMRTLGIDNNAFMDAANKIGREIKKLETQAESARAAFRKIGFTNEQATNMAKEIQTQDQLNQRLKEELNLRAQIQREATAAYRAKRNEVIRDVAAKSSNLLSNQNVAVTDTTAALNRQQTKSAIQTINTTIAGGLRTINEGDTEQMVSTLMQRIATNLQTSLQQALGNQRIERPLEEFISDIESFRQKLRMAFESRDTTLARSAEAQALVAATRRREQIGSLEGGRTTLNFTDAEIQTLTGKLQGLNDAESRLVTLNSEHARTTQQATNAQKQFKGAIEGTNTATKNQRKATEASIDSLKEQASAEKQAALGLDNLKSSLLMVVSATSIFNLVKQTIRETYQDVQQLDKSFASIAMVTKKSVAEMWDSYGLYSEMAQELGQSTNSVIQASALFYQQGLDTNEALSLTKDTMMLATLAGNDFSMATQEMTAAIRGFKMEMTEGAHVTDVYSTLAANAAASVDDIAQAMARTASIANSAGMSFENTSAFLAQMIETTQESAENLGTSLKTIIARFTELKTNIAGTSESEFEDLDVNKVDKALKSVGVQLKDSTGQIRDLDDVLLELSSKWSTLDRNTQRYVATIAAGSRQQSRFIALMDNYDRTVELTEIAADAAGKAQEQFTKYSDTIEYKSNQIKTKWEALKQSFLDSGTFGKGMDFISNLLEKLNGLDAGDFKVLTILFLTVGRRAGVNLIQGITGSIDSLGKSVNTALGKALGKIPNKITNPFTRLFEGLNDKQLKAIQLEIEKVIKKIQQAQAELNRLTTIDTNYAEGLAQQEERKQFYQNRLNRQTEELASGVNSDGKVLSGKDKTKLEHAINQTKKKLQTIEDNERTLLKLREENRKKIEQQNAQLDKQVNKQTDLETKQKDLQNKTFKDKQIDLSKYGDLAGQAFGMALTGAVTNAILTNDPGEFLANQMKMGLVSVIGTMTPQFSNLVSNLVSPAEGITRGGAILDFIKGGAITVGINAAVTGLTYLVKYLASINHDVKTQEELWEENAQAIARAAEKAQEVADASKRAVRELSTANSKEEKALKTYKELSEKTVLNSEEQEKYNNLVEEITENYSQYVTYHNEVTNELNVQVDLWEKMLKFQQEAQQRQENFALTQQAVAETLSTTNKQKEIIENLSSNSGLEKYVIEESLNQGLTSSDIISLYKERFNQSASGILDLASIFKLEDNATLDEYIKRIKNELASEPSYSSSPTKVQLSDFNKYLQDLEKIIDNMPAGAYTGTKYEEIFSKLKNDSEKFTLTLSDLKDLSDFTPPEDFLSGIEESFEDLRKTTEDLTQIQEDQIRLIEEQRYKSLHPDATRGEIVIAGIGSRKAEKGYLAAMGGATSIEEYVSGIYGNDSKEDNRIQLYAHSPYESGAKNKFKLGKTFDIGFDGQQLTNENFIEKVLQMFRETYGEKAEEEYNKFKQFYDTQEDFEKALITQTITYYQNKQADIEAEKFVKNLNDSGYSEAWNRAIEDLESRGITKSELNTAEKVLERAGLSSEEITDTLQMYQNNFSEAYKKAQDRGVQNLENALTKANIEFSNEQYKTYSNTIDQIASSNRVSDEDAQKFIQEIITSGIEAGLSEAELGGLLNLDFSQVDLTNINDFKQKVKELFISAQGESFDQADFNKFWDNLTEAGKGRNIFDFNIRNVSALEQIKDNVLESFEEIVKSANDNSKIFQGQLENGFINFTDYQALAKTIKDLRLEGTIDDYAKATSEGYELDVEKLKKAYSQRVDDENVLTNLAKEKVETGIQELETQKAAIQALLNQYDINSKNLQIDKSRLTVWEGISAAMGVTLSSDAKTKINEGKGVSLDDLGTTRGDLEKQKEEIDKNIIELRNALENPEQFFAEPEQNAAVQEILKAFELTEKATKKETDEKKKLADATKDVEDKQKALNEAIKEYNELVYGTEFRSPGLDHLYNYDEALNAFNEEISKNRDLMSDAKDIADVIDAWNNYSQATHNAIVEEQAKQKVIEESLQTYRDEIEQGKFSYVNELTGETIDVDFSQYAKLDERTGEYMYNGALLAQHEFNDDIKALIEKNIETYNKYLNEKKKSQENERKLNKELEQMRATAYKSWASMEDNIANVLKEKYKKEVDDLKEKYSSMEEADNDYLDALKDSIDKQRKLRDAEQNIQSLVEKEKKLSLMQRDTSGANQVEVKELEDDIEKDRQKILDEQVDQIIDTMKENNENQKKLTDVEIELKNAILENNAYWNSQAESIARNFTTAEDYMAWMAENSTDFAEATFAKQQALLNDYEKTFSDAALRLALESGAAIEDTLNVTQQEVIDVVVNTGETLTSEAQRSIDEVGKKLDENLTKAKEKIDDANRALEEAIEKLKELAEEEKTKASTSEDTEKDNKKNLDQRVVRRALDEAYANNLDTFDFNSKEEALAWARKNAASYSGMISTPYLEDGKYHIDAGGGMSSIRAMSNALGLDTNKAAIATALMTPGFYEKNEEDLLKYLYSSSLYQHNMLDGITNDSLTDKEKALNIIKLLPTLRYDADKYKKYASGGLIDYTGPAWVDGNPSKPESFLSSEDTQRIGEAAKLLAGLSAFNSQGEIQNFTSSTGDTNIEINIDISSIDSEEDVEYLIERIKQEIADAAKPIGTVNLIN